MMTLERSVRDALRVYRRIKVELLYSDFIASEDLIKTSKKSDLSYLNLSVYFINRSCIYKK